MSERTLGPKARMPVVLYHRNAVVLLTLPECRAAGVRFSRRWMPENQSAPGRCAVVFPIRGRAGELVAAQGRYVDELDDGAKAKAQNSGVFSWRPRWMDLAHLTGEQVL